MVKRASLHSNQKHEGLVFWIGHDQSELRMCSEQILTDPDLGLTLTGVRDVMDFFLFSHEGMSARRLSCRVREGLWSKQLGIAC
jgi:hypothetical protein